jgi:hydroxymethylglutaryl-CoA lyase
MKIIESPREAMQGIEPFIPTTSKVQYINSLLKAGFDTVEVGSFVSPKAIPQMSDTTEVLKQIERTETRSKRMLLTVNKKGAELAADIDCIDTISFPFSISPRFTELNFNSTTDRLLETVGFINNLCIRSNKSFVVYISMAFGNPYGDEWTLEIVSNWVGILKTIGIRTIPLSNVTIEIDKKLISDVFSTLVPQFPEIEFGLHLHTSNENWLEKVKAAYDHGCRRFDAVMQGMGGCPMTGKELLGNLATENLVRFLESKNEIPEGFDHMAFNEASRVASEIFNKP